MFILLFFGEKKRVKMVYSGAVMCYCFSGALKLDLLLLFLRYFIFEGLFLRSLAETGIVLKCLGVKPVLN